MQRRNIFILVGAFVVMVLVGIGLFVVLQSLPKKDDATATAVAVSTTAPATAASTTVAQTTAIPATTTAPPTTAASVPVAAYKVYVLANLNDVSDFDGFKKQLTTLKSIGVVGVESDVWWGNFEKAGDESYDWSYYKTFVEAVKSTGMKWVPILSFHQCGGNVGDNCNIPIPAWLFDGRLGSEDETKFVDEQGFKDGEYISYWNDKVYAQYEQAMQSFATTFKPYADTIDKIYVSLGPAGELRYPSYNTAAGWSYPTRGRLQSYSGPAKADFRKAIETKYKNIEAVNTAWGTKLANLNEVAPPTDGDKFFKESAFKTPYGADYMNWYQGVLTRHLDALMGKAKAKLLPTFTSARLGGKLAGIHWQYTSPDTPHAAEYNAGYFNYGTILDQFKASDVDLTFTCLELPNTEKNFAPIYSAPQNLAADIATLAKAKGVRVYGENALPIISDPKKYDNVASLLFNYNFSGFTLLRLNGVVDINGNGIKRGSYTELDLFKDKIVTVPATPPPPPKLD